MVKASLLASLAVLLSSAAYAELPEQAAHKLVDAIQKKAVQNCPKNTPPTAKFAGSRDGGLPDTAIAYVRFDGNCSSAKGWVRLSCEKLKGGWVCARQNLEDAISLVDNE
ncbi:hypothetical protein [Reyranella soli]|uniref:Uncharacterized protein n=1 Tax=Reyranella soli TaxID=1230389 RepID=A0A512NQE1_9HYPH|nr:hypothetical protein [Reyranella soli]GEP61166.1 hypothetical protein RSO01_83320 [Reyranella soli]